MASPRLATLFLFFFFCFGCFALLASAQLPQYCGKDPGLYYEYSIPAPLTNLTLRQVHTFIRHGDRLPASGGGATSYATCWPGDDAVWNCTLNYDEIPDNSPSQYSANVPRLYRKEYDAGRNVFPGNCLMGQLTQNGYEQQLANGKILREAYVIQTPLLGETLDINQVHIRSSDIPRTVQSAHTLMLGLFPPNNTGEAQIVNLHTMDVSVDPTPLNPSLCPILSEVLAAAAQSPEFIAHYTNQTAAVAAQLATALNESPDSFSLDFAFDCLNTHICHNFPVPSGVTTDLYNAMMTEETWIFQYLFTYPNTTYASQIGIGFYLQEFSEAINNFVDGDQETLFYLWSAHDTTLMLIMNMFGFSDNQWPAYASMINFELYQDDSSNYYVRTLHNGLEVTIPACGGNVYCPWNTFNTFLSTLLPVNPAVQCVPTSSQTLRDPIFDLKEDKILSHVINTAMHTAHRLAEKQHLL